MADNISFIETDDITNKVQIILRQTDLLEEVAREKLKEANFDHILVIKNFLGITEKKAPPIKSKNQEIYKQMRYKLDSSMREFNIKKENSENSNNNK
jgi:nicotinamide riboside kinase